MAEPQEITPIDVPEDDETPGYVAPAVKSLTEIQTLDQDDPSLNKYKEVLLGSQTNAVIDENNPHHCIVKSLCLVVEGREDVEVDLSDVKDLKSKCVTIKEGVQYRLKFKFFVQKEIVTGLKYMQNSYRKGIKVDKTSYMVGSYSPKMDLYEYMTPFDEAPSGMLSRGKYNVKSKFIDDDKIEYLVWDWAMEIKKDWD